MATNNNIIDFLTACGEFFEQWGPIFDNDRAFDEMNASDCVIDLVAIWDKWKKIAPAKKEV